MQIMDLVLELKAMDFVLILYWFCTDFVLKTIQIILVWLDALVVARRAPTSVQWTLASRRQVWRVTLARRRSITSGMRVVVGTASRPGHTVSQAALISLTWLKSAPISRRRCSSPPFFHYPCILDRKFKRKVGIYVAIRRCWSRE